MAEKELKIRDICGDYALDIPDYNGGTFSLYFKSKQNAENVKRIIDVDESKHNEATVCDMREIKHGKWERYGNNWAYRCSECHYVLLVRSQYDDLYAFCPNCGARMDKE